MRHRFRTWRTRWARYRWSRGWRAGLVLPRDRHGRLLTRRQRIARWWRMKRGSAPGIIRLRRRESFRTRIANQWRRRRARPPRSWADRFAAGGLAHWLAMRADRARYRRWNRRRGTPAPQPQPRGRPATTPAHTPNGTGRMPGRRTRAGGGRTVDTGAMADEIRSMAGRDFSDPQDVHDTVSGVHEIVAALQEALNEMGQRLEETGVHPAYPTAIQEAASQMSGIADELEAVTSGGVMRGPGS
jgi:hypothetical protein